MTKIVYNDMIAFHPGYYILEIIEELELTQKEFGNRVGITPKTLSLLLSGNAKINVELSAKLAKSLGTSVNYWLNLQSQYDEKVHLINLEKEAEDEYECLKLINYSYFEKLGLVEKTRDKARRIASLCKCLTISNLCYLKSDLVSVACKVAIPAMEPKNIVNLNAWIYVARSFFTKQNVEKFSVSKLKNALADIRKLARDNQKESINKLGEILNDCGVRFVVLPYLENSGINGFLQWKSEAPSIAINDRGKSHDLFWFTDFHEIKHILQGQNTKFVLDLDKSNFDDELEIDANEFARDILIPPKEYEQFISQGKFDEGEIIDFSKKISIHPGVVVGRLHYEKYIEYRQLKNLKVRCEGLIE